MFIGSKLLCRKMPSCAVPYCFLSICSHCIWLVCWAKCEGRGPQPIPDTRLGYHSELFLMMEIYGAKYLWFFHSVFAF